MNPKSTRVALLHQDPHPAHLGFADAINADLLDYRGYSLGEVSNGLLDDVVNGLRYPPYDVYLAEGSRPLFAALIRRFSGRGKLIYWAADPGFYALGRSDFRGDSITKTLIGRFGRPLARQIASRGIDGVIADSAFAAEYTRPIVGEGTPMFVVEPFVQPTVYDRLVEVSPSLDSSVVVTIGRGTYNKGADMLVDVWPRIREHAPDAELHLVGPGYPEEYAEVPGVVDRGYVDDISVVLSDAALYVHPSRGESFGVSVVEAMLAGVPAIVTESTGAKDVVRKIDIGMMVETNADALVDAIMSAFAWDTDTRESRSEASRQAARRFDAVTQRDKFCDAFYSLIEEL